MIVGAFNSIIHRSVQRRKYNSSSSSSHGSETHTDDVYDAVMPKPLYYSKDIKYVKHEDSALGKFDYNADEFEITTDYRGEPYLKYIGSETDGSKIKIPDGIVDCSRMFEGCSNLKSAPEIPKGVENCSYMFRKCYYLEQAPVIPEGVKDCSFMFEDCSLKEPPIVPHSVESTYNMFEGNPRSVKLQGKWNIEHRDQMYTDENSYNGRILPSIKSLFEEDENQLDN